MGHPDVCICGAGIIGLSLALELDRRGARVVVLGSGPPLGEASTAAAGMLAVDDPENPPALHPLSVLSRDVYPAFLHRIWQLSQRSVPVQTKLTLQGTHAEIVANEAKLQTLLPQLHPGKLAFTILRESSLDPRVLAPALLDAVRATAIDLRADSPAREILHASSGVEVLTLTGSIAAQHAVDCTGAWSISSRSCPQLRVAPRKGQMLAVALPPVLPLGVVVRTPDIYIVPRTAGPSRGRAVIGATVENAGFDRSVDPAAIRDLHTRAAELLPDLAGAQVVDSWSGLRPATPDGLPLLGPLPGRPRHLIASGHYRNGILLAPVTARVMAALIAGEPPALDLDAFSPARHFPP